MNTTTSTGHGTWHKVADLDDLPVGRVRTVAAGRRSIVLTHVGDDFGALDNRCPHQGGPLGEGSIEKGWLRCPWHGYDYDPLTGTPPPGFTDAPGALPGRGARRRRLRRGARRGRRTRRTVSDVMVETMVAWGVTHVFGMVGHSNLGFADAMRRQEEAGALTFVGIRHEGAAVVRRRAYGKLTGRAAACFGIAGPGSTNLLTGLYDAKADRARRCSRSRGRCRRRCWAAARSRTSTSPPRSPTSPAGRRRCSPSPTTPSS